VEKMNINTNFLMGVLVQECMKERGCSTKYKHQIFSLCYNAWVVRWQVGRARGSFLVVCKE
jgi:hypothetical protein